jgi:hypothetical protein
VRRIDEVYNIGERDAERLFAVRGAARAVGPFLTNSLSQARLEALRAPLEHQLRQNSLWGNRSVYPAWKHVGRVGIYVALSISHTILRALDMFGISLDDD